jgi:hypothetical protein
MVNQNGPGCQSCAEAIRRPRPIALYEFTIAAALASDRILDPAESSLLL